MARPYAFRYPVDIAATLDPWRDQLGRSFDQVVSILADRDRAIEDHLSLAVAQGYLGIGELTSVQTGLTTADTDVTNLTVTVTVPAGRRLKITVHSMIDNENGGSTAIGVLKIQEDGVTIAHRESYLDAHLGLREGQDIDFCAFRSPSAGVHTYKVVAGITSNSGRIFATSTRPSFITVEDIGPADRS